MKHIRKIIALFFAISFTTACGQKETNTIHISGYTYGGKAFYWKDGETVYLSPEYYKSYVKDMKIVNGDVYCVGYAYSSEDAPAEAVIWKNGIKKVISNSYNSAYANALEIVDGKIYVVGQVKDGPRIVYGWGRVTIDTFKAKLWTSNSFESGNFKEMNLTNGENGSGNALDIYVDNDNIAHIVGEDNYCREPSWHGSWYKRNSRYWKVKDSRIIETIAPISGGKASATTIFADDYGIYIGGFTKPDDSLTACYWHDGFEREFQNESLDINNGISYNGNIYMVGSYFDDAAYYKNYNLVEIVTEHTGADSYIYGIDCKGEDVYMSGNNGNLAGYWKNHKFKSLGFNGTAKTIIVESK